MIISKNSIRYVGTLGLLMSLLYTSSAQATEYEADLSHSKVGFTIKHMFSLVDGEFTKYKVSMTFDPAKEDKSVVQADIETASIYTGDKKRDEHLRSAEFFDTAKYPKITFKSTSVSSAGKDKLKVIGNLTLHGVTKEVTLYVDFLGKGKDPWGNLSAGFTGTTKINRKDFGMVWNKTLDTGGYLLGEEVSISLKIEAHEKKAPGSTK